MKQSVLDELEWEPSVKAAHIGVTARNGLVTLTGHVESYAGHTKGDQFVTLNVMLPIGPDPELDKFMNTWQPATPYNLRTGFEV